MAETGGARVRGCPVTSTDATKGRNRTHAAVNAEPVDTVRAESVSAKKPPNSVLASNDNGDSGCDASGDTSVDSTNGAKSPPCGASESKNQLRKRRRQERHEQRKEFWKAKKKELKAQKRSRRLQSVEGGEKSPSESGGFPAESCLPERAERVSAESTESKSTLSLAAQAEAGRSAEQRKTPRRAPRPSLCRLAGVSAPGSGDCRCRETGNGCLNADDSAPAPTPSPCDKEHSSSKAQPVTLMSTAGSACSRCSACLRGSVGIVVDCDFEHLQTEREILSLSQQLMYSYGACRRHNKAAQLSCRTESESDCPREESKSAEMWRSDPGRDACSSGSNPLSETSETTNGAPVAGESEDHGSDTPQKSRAAEGAQGCTTREAAETSSVTRPVTPHGARDTADLQVNRVPNSDSAAAGNVRTHQRPETPFSDSRRDASGEVDICRTRDAPEGKKVLPVCFSIAGVGPQLAAHLNAFQGFPRWRCEAYTERFSELYLNRNPVQRQAADAQEEANSEQLESAPATAASIDFVDGATQTGADPQVVYLSGDAEEILQDMRPGYRYVIGGVVDRNRHKGLTVRKSKEEKVHAARLPIREYLGRELDGSAILTVNQVVEILLGYLSTRDWHAALVKAFPTRKGRRESGVP
ncbi:putative tRNA (guanine-N1)-methyltransferase [Neospora caninum Liverpool]|uniref:tRNA (guanine(9)-N(1))-methyltransferase n=1 Tax=Neospora caninum (strain Liverpool) TaxID=572307 RepID=F0VN08_NEOCL|nr:putative tRNA (guanine-N1)-methyltransferase [Neospora caninum Liverpool]CBZ55104.1 putative tRNA (guanine-N1)-methyltransferase [Neospora caninum Liverpool]CEL69830.1 TPA: tRNA (guanine-N1)-methyltransferase, putative [Neospora caninum Liverpool]|eukprot:XP_003885132.1 putative tRNA (guanine-N1)-methyltransferase [Neospora caninum Liverpool]